MSDSQGQQVDVNDIIEELTVRIGELTKEVAITKALAKKQSKEIETLRSGDNSK